jgi:chromosome segregation ATPase
MPLFIYVNVSPSGVNGQGEEVARAIADVDQAVAALKSAANVSSGGVPGEEGQLGEQAPTPEEFVGNTNGPQDENINNQNIENKNIEDEEDPEEEESSEDIMQRKNNQRRKINAYEGSNMAEKDAEIKLFEKTIEDKEKQIADLQASVTKNEGTIGELSDKVKEYEISLNEAKEVVGKFDDERKATKEKIDTLTAENEKLSNKNRELVLFPKRYKAAKLALHGSEDEKEIKTYIEKISSFSEEQVDTLIKSFEDLAKRIPQADPDKPGKSGAVKGDVDTQLNEDGNLNIDKLAEEYQGLDFLARAAPDKYKIEK